MNGSNEIYSIEHRAYTSTNIMEQFKSPLLFYREMHFENEWLREEYTFTYYGIKKAKEIVLNLQSNKVK